MGSVIFIVMIAAGIIWMNIWYRAHLQSLTVDERRQLNAEIDEELQT